MVKCVDMVVNVEVEYCANCCYLSLYRQLERHIKRAVTDVQIRGFAQRIGSFEVKINDQLVHSKLQTMRFPDFKTIIDLVIKASQQSEL